MSELSIVNYLSNKKGGNGTIFRVQDLKTYKEQMEEDQEYSILKVFNGNGWRGASYGLPSGWYIPELEKILPADEIEGVLTDFVTKGIIEIKAGNQIFFLPAGKDLFDRKYYKDQAYDIVDTALNKIRERNDGINTHHKRSQRITTLAESIIDDNNLVQYLSYDKREFSMVQLLNVGHEVVDMGGIRNYLNKLKMQKSAIDTPTEQIFDPGQYYDAYNALRERIKRATRSIVLFDNYTDEGTLTFFKGKSPNISLHIVTLAKCLRDPAYLTAIDMYSRQYGKLTTDTRNDFHDRFLVIDDKFFYHIGASIKDVGRKVFMFSQMEDKDVCDAIRAKIGNSI